MENGFPTSAEQHVVGIDVEATFCEHEAEVTCPPPPVHSL